MKLDPLDEVNYRRKLAQGYLNECRQAFLRGDWRNTVACAQLCAENAAKAVIALFRIPSWTHDPSEELNHVASLLPEEARQYVARLAEISHRLAPEHSRTVYGEPTRRLSPWKLYSKSDAEEALKMAEEAVKLMEHILSLCLGGT